MCDKKPLVSIIMPVHNAEKYICDSLNSILTQTYKNLEIIIIDDASDDKSVDIISQVDDERIVLIRNERNLKQSLTRNKGIALAKGKYIANMDADDISEKTRIQEQVEFMENHDDIDICGTFLKAFGNNKRYIMKFPVHPHDLMIQSIYASPFGHPAVMIRKSSIDRYGIKYDSNYTYSQDFELWSRIAFKGARFANIPKTLFYYRVSDSQISNKHYAEQQIFRGSIVERNVNSLINDKIRLFTLTNNRYALADVKKDVKNISIANFYNCECFKEDDIDSIKKKIIFIILNRSSFMGVKIIPLYLKFFWREIYKKDIIKLLVKIFIKYNPAKIEEDS